MERVVFEEERLGTLFRITVICSSSELDLVGSKIKEAFAEAKRVELAYSRFLQGNELFDLNNKVGQWVQVSEELFELLKFGKRLNEQTEGAFDLTVKSLLEAWGYDPEYSFKLKEGAKLGSIELKKENLVRLGAPVEIGAIGKGYTVDRMVEILKILKNFCINAGGDIFAEGSDLIKSESKKDSLALASAGWKIVLEDPRDLSRAIGETYVQGFAVACSSPIKRSWLDKHHLIDARKFKPAAKMCAVYTQAKNCLWADAYSTALFVLGFEEAKYKVGKFPVEALLISKDGMIFKTDAFKVELFET